MDIVDQIRFVLRENITSSPEKSKMFFKTTPGSYAENDIFLGVTNPNLRKIAKHFSSVELNSIKQLLDSSFNEERLLALFILVNKYPKDQHNVYNFYIENIKSVNNWNLVDSSAHLILGAYLFDKDRSILIDLALSDDIWKKRISIISTLYFIRKNDLDWTLRISKILSEDKNDLIQKAVGWMLREVGKKCQNTLMIFLNQNKMQKTTLRCVKEKFPIMI